MPDLRTGRWTLCCALVLICAALEGCSRRHYRQHADRDAYELLAEHSWGTPWEIPEDFSVYPSSDSRLADVTDTDWPCLPPPGPVLFTQPESVDSEPADLESLPSPSDIPPSTKLRRLPLLEQTAGRESAIQLVSFDDPKAPGLERLPSPSPELAAEPLQTTAPGRSSVQPVPAEYWRSVPDSCLERMLEFESVRAEYRREFQDIPSDALPDVTQGLTLAQIVDLARRNSREYQTQKEQLYTAALAVSLIRFEYELKFSPFGNGSSLDYAHTRNNGETINTLSIPSAYQIEKTLATGGQLLARFANDVLLTFNGPQGFSYDVGSELLFDFTQSILQRDILLEPLHQAERDLIYAARTYIRFRKEFFFGLASEYYNILRIYRNIEIDSQNYFSLVRTVEQAREEIRSGVKDPPNQVALDQFEQSMLSGRRSLIETCNQLERALDQLKLTMGVPTEQAIDLSLRELEQLTLQDEIEVAAERVDRWRQRALEQREKPQIDRGELLNADVFLAERLLEWGRLRRKLQPDTPPPDQLSDLLLRFRIDQAFVEVSRNRRELARSMDPAIPQPIILIYRRTTDVIDAQLEMAQRQIRQLQTTDGDRLQPYRNRLRQVTQRLAELQESVARILEGEQVALKQLLADAQRLLANVDNLVRELEQLRGGDPTQTEAKRLEETIRLSDQLLSMIGQFTIDSQTGLPKVNLEVTDAMLTALVQRLDLMNERGLLADDWRRVKLAADDLKSVLNFRASHSLRTDRNLPFDFDFDDSRTDLRLSLDLPLNRRAQRNSYREALIGYQFQRRQLMQFEDDIKFQIRDRLRTLELTRVQYPISVTQAALAAEQVVSVRLQLTLGVADVRYIDLLLALQALREALSDVAVARIGYLVDRARFVLDLELMQLDEDGFWPPINDPQYQPVANTLYPCSAGPTYGHLSPWVLPSKLMRHLYHHPLPGEKVTLIGGDSETRDGSSEEEQVDHKIENGAGAREDAPGR